MDFYESISVYYDHIFPVDAQAVRFLAARARAGPRVLARACGTGGHAVELARLGHRVTGVDLDAAMIRLAQAKAGAAGGKGGPDFRVLDMREAGKSLPAGVGRVYWLGNSLLHLERETGMGGGAGGV